jgi:hypothetical protein
VLILLESFSDLWPEISDFDLKRVLSRIRVSCRTVIMAVNAAPFVKNVDYGGQRGTLFRRDKTS